MRSVTILTGLFLLIASHAMAFCGFYVAKADGELYNEASKVVYVRNNNRSVITMSSDYQGAVKDFAMIVPTPKVLRRSDIRTVKSKTIDHLDAYSAPRLVEYKDHDPCAPQIVYEALAASDGLLRKNARPQKRRGPASFGVTVKAKYAVGIYDIVILKARQSDGLVAYLTQEGYKLPEGAAKPLAGYIKGGMKFFVARVNLARHNAAEKADLEPLQISFRSKNFMLPIQLGKVNSQGSQDVLAYFLTNTGRVETANYKTERIPTDPNLPIFVEELFGKFYKDMFTKAVGKAGVILEYAWDMAWCDPCAADPLSKTELKELGVNWLKPTKNAGQDVFVTRLHMRYDKNSMLKDPVFEHTNDRQNFQGRYVMNQPFTGEITCKESKEYVKQKRKAIRQEAKDLRKLTDWRMADINKWIKASLPQKFWP